jgi:drug/metabolite transporter (DMT)-like permease
VLTFQPVSAVLLAMLILDEDPSAVQLVGVAVVVCGIVLATTGRRSSDPDLT